MIETILVFVRNCVMAVLTAWAGVHIADKAGGRREAPAETTAAASPAVLAPVSASSEGPECKQPPAPPAQPSSAASSGPEPVSPGFQPNVLTIR